MLSFQKGDWDRIGIEALLASSSLARLGRNGELRVPVWRFNEKLRLKSLGVNLEQFPSYAALN